MDVQPLLLGHSSQNLELKAVLISSSRSAKPAPTVFLLGAVHGDEVEGVWLLDEVQKILQKNYAYSNIRTLIWNPVNPDGVVANQRCNGRGVDLNRNLPTKDWTAEVKNPRYPPGPTACSESESRVLVKLIDEYKPCAILSVHSFHKFQINKNGPSDDWAEKLAQVCGYPVTRSIGYPTPGCLGDYAGLERGIPTITLEIERGLSQEKVLQLHVPVVRATLEYWDHWNAH
jgi:murein peptide amidase A